MRVVGVDGCPGGWIAVSYDGVPGVLNSSTHWSFTELLHAHADAERIGIDIPIGLAEGVPRQCDVDARKVLFSRRSSVFPAPDFRIVHTPRYADALAQSYKLCGKGISRQAFGIFPKVAEVNDFLTPDEQVRVVEVHPEVSFWALAGGNPMRHSKKTMEGFEERRALLVNALQMEIPDRPAVRTMAKPGGADDLLDATVVAWTTWRVAAGTEGRFPSEPPVDRRGLRMEIVY
jgi:predicted RNase H-like nuclease